ncbi:TolC family protein [Treponema pectinovorum]|uniref:TolC family protein n=1 Tax=Treponema pectinovorum TaxID=164 RepID=UPI0011CABA9C|nr:TolC family protein [Treponema pectinovorum]
MKRIIFLSLFFYICLLGVFAENSTESKKYTLSVDDAVKIALENNVSVKRQTITLEAAARAKKDSWNSISPSVSVGATSSIPVDSLTFGDQSSSYNANLAVNASVSVNFSANLYTSIKNAKLSYEQSRISFEDALRSIEFSVRESYYELLYKKENIALQEENLSIAKKQYETNLAKYNSGRLSEVDSLSAEVNYKSMIPTVENARTDYINSMDSFKQVLGLMIEDEVELTGSLSDELFLDEVTVDEKNVTSSIIKVLQSKLESAKLSVLDKRFSAFAPTVNATYSWKDSTWYYANTQQSDPKKSSSITLSASIPLDGILPWSSKNNAIDSAKDSVKDYELQLDDEKKSLIRTINISLRSIKQSQEAILSKQANVELAQKTCDMTEEAYNRGTKDLLTLQTANNTLLTAQLTLNSEILTLTKAMLNLERAAGLNAGSLKNK